MSADAAAGSADRATRAGRDADEHSGAGDPGAGGAHAQLETLVIEPRRGFRGPDLAELWRHRELLYFLVWRDVKVKYRMALLGVAWAVLVPVLSMLIYGVFGHAAGLARHVQPPYFLYLLAGLLPWLFIQRAINDGGQSLVNQQPLMSKIYLPRLLIPATSCGGALVDLLISLALLAGVAGWYAARGQWSPSWELLAVVPLLGLTLIAALATAIGLSALTVLYRDMRFLIPFLTQFGLWLSAVPFPASIFGKWKALLAINPYAGIVSGWRSAIHGEPWEWTLLAGSIVLSPLLLVASVWYFRRVERRFADVA